MPIEHCSTVDKLMDYIPDVIEKAQKILDKKMDSNSENQEENKIENRENGKKKNITVKTTERKVSPDTKERIIKAIQCKEQPKLFTDCE